MSISMLSIMALSIAAGTTEPPSACSQSSDAARAQVASYRHETAPQDIVATAVGAGSFKTLAAALTAAGLVDTLKGPGPFTVFAPSDEAFAKLPKETLAMLLKPENKEKLAAILTYHVVPGRVYADQVGKLGSATTVQGQKVEFTAKGGKAMVNGANIVGTDIETSNGVIHVIDSVIMPK